MAASQSHAEWDDAVWESIKEEQGFQESDRFAVDRPHQGMGRVQ